MTLIDERDFPRVHTALSRARLTVKERGISAHAIVVRFCGMPAAKEHIESRASCSRDFARSGRFSRLHRRHRCIHA